MILEKGCPHAKQAGTTVCASWENCMALRQSAWLESLPRIPPSWILGLRRRELLRGRQIAIGFARRGCGTLDVEKGLLRCVATDPVKSQVDWRNRSAGRPGRLVRAEKEPIVGLHPPCPVPHAACEMRSCVKGALPSMPRESNPGRGQPTSIWSCQVGPVHFCVFLCWGGVLQI